MTAEDCLKDEKQFLKELSDSYEKKKMEGIVYVLKQRIFVIEKKIKSLNELPEKVY